VALALGATFTDAGHLVAALLGIALAAPLTGTPRPAVPLADADADAEAPGTGYP
jgi:hypothetical protein